MRDLKDTADELTLKGRELATKAIVQASTAAQPMLCARYGHRVRIEEVDGLCATLVEIGREHSQPIRLGGERR